MRLQTLFLTAIATFHGFISLSQKKDSVFAIRSNGSLVIKYTNNTGVEITTPLDRANYYSEEPKDVRSKNIHELYTRVDVNENNVSQIANYFPVTMAKDIMRLSKLDLPMVKAHQVLMVGWVDIQGNGENTVTIKTQPITTTTHSKEVEKYINKNYILFLMPPPITVDGKLDERLTRERYVNGFNFSNNSFYNKIVGNDMICFVTITSNLKQTTATILPMNFPTGRDYSIYEKFNFDTSSVYALKSGRYELKLDSWSRLGFVRKTDCRFFTNINISNNENMLYQLIKAFNNQYVAQPKYDIAYLTDGNDKKTIHCNSCDFPAYPEFTLENNIAVYHNIIQALNNGMNKKTISSEVPHISDLQWTIGNLMMVELNDFNRYFNLQ